MLIVCKQLTGQPWYLSVDVAFAFNFYSLKLKKKIEKKEDKAIFKC